MTGNFVLLACQTKCIFCSFCLLLLSLPSVRNSGILHTKNCIINCREDGASKVHAKIKHIRFLPLLLPTEMILPMMRSAMSVCMRTIFGEKPLAFRLLARTHTHWIRLNSIQFISISMLFSSEKSLNYTSDLASYKIKSKY